MSKITWKPGTMLAPVPPALISCGTVEKPNMMTAAWTGIIASDPALTYVSIRPSRYSHELISKSGEFVINLTNLPLVKAADWCGVKSGRNIDKFKEMGLTAEACSEIKAPQIKEAPVSLECKVIDVKSYGTHDMFLAEIAAVNVDDKYIDDNGKLWLEKAGLIAYVHGFYYTLGRNIGKFGFSVEKKPNKTKKPEFEKKAESPEIKFNWQSSRKCHSEQNNIFEMRKPKRLSDVRKKRGDTPKLKKFDGEIKFKKARRENEVMLSAAPKKHYGKLKTKPK